MKNITSQSSVREYYDKDSDVKWVIFSDGPEAGYIEVAPGVNVEINAKNEVIGVEIMNYSKRILRNVSSANVSEPKLETRETMRIGSFAKNQLANNQFDYNLFSQATETCQHLI